VVETPKPNLVAGIRWFLGTDISWFNRRHRLGIGFRERSREADDRQNTTFTHGVKLPEWE